MEIGTIRKVNIDEEMQHSYLDYAMSVIVSRALPDARDGLKPVQRRILYAMHDMGLRPDSEYKKSARIVGEVLGKYHPHGDQAVYEAMARMAQDFSMRYMLVDGQGNFGSVDGDPPAAMRYTEARLKTFTLELINQIDRNTVDFLPNFDDTLKEPEVLPAAIPNLLVNGATGIAVGMATNIPPHNLGEIVDALDYVLEKWDKFDDIDVDDLMKFVKGPDFPTGGIILQENQENDLHTVYATGRGRVVVRGQVHIEEMGRGKSRLIVTELPYMTNKSALIEKIADLVRNDGLEGIVDLRDESDRHGMRIVIELGKAADEEKVLRELYRRTQLQANFGINLLALINGAPHLLSLKQALKVFLDHRLKVVERRSRFDLEKAQQRAHILEGLRVALKNLDEIINLIRRAEDTEDARVKLMKRYKLSEVQAQAILDMPLKRLAALERKKIEIEYQELQALIKSLEALLSSPKRMREVVEKELMAVKETYADRRRTQIVSLKEGEKAATLLTKNDLVPAEAVWVGISKDMLIGRTPGEELPRFRGGEAPLFLIKATTHQTLYLAAKNGKASAIAIHSLPEVEHFSEGTPLGKASVLREDNQLAAVFTSEERQEEGGNLYAVTVSKMGMVKKSLLSDLPGPTGELFTLAKVNDDDELGWVVKTKGSQDLFLVTKTGMGIRFSEEDVRPMGLVAAGVNGLKLAAGDSLAGASLITDKDEVLLLAENGTAWRMAGSEFPRQGRYGQGVTACKPVKGSSVTGLLVGSKTQQGIIHMAKMPAKQIRLDIIPAAKRTRAGHELLELRGNETALGITPVEGRQEGHAAREKGEAPRQHAEHIEQPNLFSLPEPDGGKEKAGKTAERKPKAVKAKNAPAAKSVKAVPKKSTQAVSTPAAGKSKAPVAKTKAAPAAKTKAAPPAAKVKSTPVKAKTAPAATAVKTGSGGKAKAGATPVKAAAKTKPASATEKTRATTPKTTAKPAKAKAPVSKAPSKPAKGKPELAGKLEDGDAPASRTSRQRVKVK